MMKIQDSEKLPILTEHYKESFSQQKQNIRMRDRLFYLIILVLGIMMLLVFSSSMTNNLINEILSQKLGLKSLVNIEYINTIFWLILLGLVLRYFQYCQSIEVLYNYLWRLESRICGLLDEDIFTREGRFYKDNKTIFRKWASKIYKVFFPLALLAGMTIKIFSEIPKDSWHLNSFQITDSVLYLISSVSVLLYWASYKKIRKTKKPANNIKFINK